MTFAGVVGAQLEFGQSLRMFSKTIAMFLLLACACDAVKAKADVVNKQMMRREGAMDTNTKLGFQAQKQRLVLDSKGGESDGAHAAHVVKASSGDKRNAIFDSNGLTEFQRGNEAVCYESLPLVATQEGTHLATMSYASLSDCKTACNNNAACRSFAACPGDGDKCYLKNKVITDSEPQRNVGRQCKTYYQAPCKACLVERNYDYVGSDLSFIDNVASAEVCAQLCGPLWHARVGPMAKRQTMPIQAGAI